jgi:hypothetical protein
MKSTSVLTSTNRNLTKPHHNLLLLLQPQTEPPKTELSPTPPQPPNNRLQIPHYIPFILALSIKSSLLLFTVLQLQVVHGISNFYASVPLSHIYYRHSLTARHGTIDNKIQYPKF